MYENVSSDLFYQIVSNVCNSSKKNSIFFKFKTYISQTKDPLREINVFKT